MGEKGEKKEEKEEKKKRGKENDPYGAVGWRGKHRVRAFCSSKWPGCAASEVDGEDAVGNRVFEAPGRFASPQIPREPQRKE